MKKKLKGVVNDQPQSKEYSIDFLIPQFTTFKKACYARFNEIHQEAGQSILDSQDQPEITPEVSQALSIQQMRYEAIAPFTKKPYHIKHHR